MAVGFNYGCSTYTHIMANLKCPICRKEVVVNLQEVNGYNFCTNCKLTWLKNFPHTEYSKDYYKGQSSLISRVFYPIGLFFYKIRNNYVTKTNLNLWIDIGAGAGEYLKTVKSKNKIGVEVSSDGRKLMEHAGLSTMSPKQYLKSKDLKADVISFWHVLEHLEKPWEYLSVAKKNLSTNGEVVIGVPNIDSLEFKFFKNYWFHLAPMYHLWHFSPLSMEIMLRKEGLKIIRIDYLSPEHQIAGIIQSLINRTSKSDAVLHKLVKRGDNELIAKKGLLWTLFWLTVGLPLIFAFWLVASILKKSGTFVVIAKVVGR
jgi:hypothetical protein